MTEKEELKEKIEELTDKKFPNLLKLTEEEIRNIWHIAMEADIYYKMDFE